MLEARVPMTLRDSFLQDPFFNSAWDDMDTLRSKFFNEFPSMDLAIPDATETRSGALLPSLPGLGQDSALLSLKDGPTLLEISLDTAGFKPEELAVKVEGGELVVRGKHEERTQAGQVAVARQFTRRYTLPAEAKLAAVESNLSQDGVMLITVPKEKRIQEVKEEQKKKVEHNINKSSELKQNENAVKSIRKMSTGRKSSLESNLDKMESSMVPMTLRDPFFDDPFFKDNWLEIKNSKEGFFSKARNFFNERLSALETGSGAGQLLQIGDSAQLRVVEDDSKLELSLDTAGYKPDELKVTAGRGIICVEGKHEEKTEAGQVMVSRQFSRQYGLPANSKAEEVVSNLSQDGVLLVTVPKRKAVGQERRQVPIETKQ
jgi:HSP20 family molecular chaperone IbpA